LACDHYGGADAIITNPPYTRAVMHRLIEHLPRIAPTWLSLELDWTATKQAAPFMRACSDVVAVGRFKWIPGSPHTGKENFAWLRFDARHVSGPLFHWRNRPALRQRAVTCMRCGASYVPQRADARFCSNACRQRAYRDRLSVTQA
jgi:hypothetical protein